MKNKTKTNNKVIQKKELEHLYLRKKYSAARIPKQYRCSENKVNYWLRKFNISKRSISDAIYSHHNPKGDPFIIRELDSLRDGIIYGLGLGLYWGEVTKSNKASIRLGNTDPRLIIKFIEFLEKIYRIDKSKLKFGLQIFNDLDPKKAKQFWKKHLDIKSSQFQKVVVTKARGSGTYKTKIKHGVLTVYYNNKKLRDIIIKEIEKL